VFIQFAEEKIDGSVLYSLLERHLLLPEALKNPAVCMMAANTMNVGFLHDDGEKPMAVLLETTPEPGIVGLLFISERAHINQRRDELIEVSIQLRERWFGQMGAVRVESRIPIERTQTIRCLRHMGFKVETMPKGLRNAVIYNSKPKDLCVMSLLPSDPVKELSKQVEEPTLMMEGENG
jgi:hypothetical protein